MKKILSIAVLLTGITFGSFAQESPAVKKDLRKQGRKDFKKERVVRSPEQIAKVQTERLDKELKFTDVQREKVYKLKLDQAQKDKVRQDARAKEMKLVREEKKAEREKFQGLLSAEQKKLVQEKFAQREGKNFRRGEEGRKFREGERMHRKPMKQKVEETPTSNT